MPLPTLSVTSKFDQGVGSAQTLSVISKFDQLGSATIPAGSGILSVGTNYDITAGAGSALTVDTSYDVVTGGANSITVSNSYDIVASGANSITVATSYDIAQAVFTTKNLGISYDMQPVVITARDIYATYDIAVPVDTARYFHAVYDLVAHDIANRTLAVGYDLFSAQVTLSNHKFTYDLFAPTISTKLTSINYDLNIPQPTTKLFADNYDLLIPEITSRLISLEYTNNPAISNFDLTLPQMALAGTDVSGDVSYFDLHLPLPTVNAYEADNFNLSIPLVVDAIGDVEIDGKASLILPLPTVSIVDNVVEPPVAIDSQFDISIPLTASIVADNVIDGTASISIPQITLSVNAFVEVTGSANITLPAVTLDVIADRIHDGTANLNIGLSLDAQAIVGHAGSVLLTMPTLTIQAQGYTDSFATADLYLPAFRLGVLGQNADGSSTFTGWALNMENNALTEYTGWAFNSMANFNGVNLAANSNGIFKIGGASDNGVAIQADALTGETDFGTTKIKRVREAFLGYRGGGLSVKTVTDGATRTYSSNNVVSGIHEQRVKLSRGLKSRYWQFGISNVSGADFQLDSIEVEPFELERKVR